MSVLPPVFVEFVGTLGGLKTATKGVKAELTSVEKSGGGSMARLGVLSKAALLGVAGAVVVLGGETLHMAGDFQQGITRLSTGAGEAQSNLKLVSDGILTMAGQVGQGTKELNAGMYLVESAGFHGADALNVLRNAAMGAKVGNADLATTADAVTTVLNAYHMGANQAAQATNALIAAEGQGKTNLEALAGSMATVLPIASAAHVGLNEVLGAMSTMTAEGTPAADAATYLKQTIGQLSNPTAKAAQEMKSLGLNSVDVSQSLGTRGLAATLTMLTDAIKSKMGPAGTVLIEHLQKAAKNTTAFQQVLAQLPPAQQTYVGALATMVGGTKSMQAALELTGDNMATFQHNTDVISEKVKTGGNNIEGWAQVQKNLNQKLAEAKGQVEALGIRIGTVLLPVATKLLTWSMDSAQWLGRHKDVLIAVGAVLAGALVVGLHAAAMAAQEFTVALLANPMTWIVLGIAALIFAIVELVMHWKAVWGAIWDLMKGIGSWFAGPFAHFFIDVWNKIYNGFLGPIGHAFTVVFQGIINFFRKWWPLLLVIFLPVVAIIMAIWNHFHTQIMEVVHAVWDAIVVFLKANWDGIKGVAKAVWEAIKLDIVDPIMWVWHQLVDLGTKIWHAIKDPLDQAWNDAKQFADKYMQVGDAIVMGIVHGIEGAAHWVLDKVKGLANDALKGVKSFLGISSPSAVFADQVGQWIPHGIAAGVTRYSGVAVGSVAALAGRLGGMGSIALPGVGGAGFAGAALAGAGGGMLQADISIDGTKFMRAIVPYQVRQTDRNDRSFSARVGSNR